ncbi:MAG: hypothetical protein ACTSQE_06465 [Candidatus Heimdallarchaeaceae archaeon]
MSNVARLVRVGGYAAKYLSGMKTNKEELKKRIEQYPVAEIDLTKTWETISALDLNEKGYEVLTIEKWKERPEVISDFNIELDQKLQWINTGIFRITFIPMIPKYRNNGLPIRIITVGNPQFAAMTKFGLFAEYETESFIPSMDNIVCEIGVISGRITVVDAFFSGLSLSKDEITLLLASDSGLLKLRIKLKFQKEEMKVKDFDELKKSRFFGLADQKNVHPNVVKRIVTKLVIGNDNYSIKDGMKFTVFGAIGTVIFVGVMILFSGGWFFYTLFGVLALSTLAVLLVGVNYISSVRKCKKLKLLNKGGNTRNINFEDPLWIKEFCEIATYWKLNNDAGDLFTAAVRTE